MARPWEFVAKFGDLCLAESPSAAACSRWAAVQPAQQLSAVVGTVVPRFSRLEIKTPGGRAQLWFAALAVLRWPQPLALCVSSLLLQPAACMHERAHAWAGVPLGPDVLCAAAFVWGFCCSVTLVSVLGEWELRG